MCVDILLFRGDATTDCRDYTIEEPDLHHSFQCTCLLGYCRHWPWALSSKPQAGVSFETNTTVLSTTMGPTCAHEQCSLILTCTCMEDCWPCPGYSPTTSVPLLRGKSTIHILQYHRCVHTHQSASVELLDDLLLKEKEIQTQSFTEGK